MRGRVAEDTGGRLRFRFWVILNSLACPKVKAKGKRTPSAWNSHVQSEWTKNKGKKGYQFKDALKDAAKSYKGKK